MVGISKILLVRCTLPFLLASLIAAQEPPAAKNLIHVDITGLRNDKGQVYCALFSTAADFPGHADKAVARTKSAIDKDKAVCEFTGIAPGTYAVSTYHDENSNGKLDTNFMGIPQEGVGASNNAKGHFGPPKFEDAAIPFKGGRLDLKIKIDYL
jgi:uncharacterized protein (DUF2141 family)